MLVFVGLAAIAVDLGRSYVVGQQGQRAADAAAMAGVVSLPGDQATAKTTALRYATLNGFTGGPTRVRRRHLRRGRYRRATDPAAGHRDPHGPHRLRLRAGRARPRRSRARPWPTTPVRCRWAAPATSTATTPTPRSPERHLRRHRRILGQRRSPLAPKGNGDAYQNDMATNTDFDANGYFYSVTVAQPVSTLTIQAFDPALRRRRRRLHRQQPVGGQDPACGQDGGHRPVDPVRERRGQRTAPATSATAAPARS